MTLKARWQPFQDLGEDDPHNNARVELDLMRSMLDRALGRDGGQAVATGRGPAWAPTLDVSERSDAYLSRSS